MFDRTNRLGRCGGWPFFIGKSGGGAADYSVNIIIKTAAVFLRIISDWNAYWLVA